MHRVPPMSGTLTTLNSIIIQIHGYIPLTPLPSCGLSNVVARQGITTDNVLTLHALQIQYSRCHRPPWGRTGDRCAPSSDAYLSGLQTCLLDL